jgi:Protein of unknown function (DUF1592)/Protein of unknown function (DUF1588)/Protein of unknown function (DUF1595)/Protein of unknown function (DUF1587)/Protein of unknown function (DUF1585)
MQEGADMQRRGHRGLPSSKLGAQLLLIALTGCYQGIAGGGGRASGGAEDGGSIGEGGESGDDGGSGPAAACEDGSPSVAPTRMRLLTRYEYDNTIRDLLGDATHPAQGFAPENRSGIFENDAGDHKVSKDVVRQYLDASEDIAARTVAERFAELLPCDPIADGEPACGHALVEELLPRAFRRPADASELAAFGALFDSSYAQFGFTTGVELTVSAILQSPQFLYRFEGVPEGAAPGDLVAVDGYEMASRLSYFLTSSMPDDELFAAAADGRLGTAEEVEAHARRLLEGERARESVAQFHRQWLGLGALASVSKDPAAFPTLDPTTFAGDWNDSVQRFIAHVFFDGEATVTSLFGAREVFLSDELAAFYGATGLDPQTGAYTMQGDYAGLLTQPGMLGMLAYPDGSSPVARGVFVRKRMLCQELSPPPNVPIVPPDPDANATTRERFEQHSSDPACAGCHGLIDPIGFTFEHYDGAGRWRDDENGKPIDSSSSGLVNVTDPQAQGPLADALELSAKLAQSSDVQECLIEQWSTFALGRGPDPVLDTCTTEQLRATFADSGGDLQELMVGIAVSDAFRFRIVDGGDV